MKTAYSDYSLSIRDAFTVVLLCLTLVLIGCGGGGDGGGGGPATGILFGVAKDIDIGEGKLVTVDVGTGAISTIGVTGLFSVSAIDYDPLTKKLYATGTVNSQLMLAELDRITGASNLIAVLTPINGNGNLASNVADMSFRSDGVLFARPNNLSFVTINVADGSTTLLGPNVNSRGNGLTFNSSDTLLHAGPEMTIGGFNSLEIVNQTDGSRSFLTSLDYSGSLFDAANTLLFPRVGAMDLHVDTGVIYAAIMVGAGNSATSFLAILNVTNGTFNYIGAMDEKVDALAWGE